MLQYQRFSDQRCWWFKTTGMWHRVTGRVLSVECLPLRSVRRYSARSPNIWSSGFPSPLLELAQSLQHIFKSAGEHCLCSCTTHWHTLHHICSLPYIPTAAHATMKAMNSSRQMTSVQDLFCMGPLNVGSCFKGSPETKGKKLSFDKHVILKNNPFLQA